MSNDVRSTMAWRYHQATNHSIKSLHANRHYLDWTNQPRPYKRYAGDLERLTFPREVVPSTMPALSALAGGTPIEGERVPDAALLSTVLQLSAGITKWLQFPGGRMAFRAAACTGALYHIDLYAVCGDLPGVPAGVYHFDVENVALNRLRDGDCRAGLATAAEANERVNHAPVTLVASSTWWRNAWKYQARTYRHAFWDSGTILANLLSVAAAHDLPAGVVLGFADSTVNGLLDLDPAHEAALELIPLGRTAAEPPLAPPMPILGLPVQPYSFTEVDYPLIRQVHAATSVAWQSVGEDQPYPQPRLPAGEGIEAVIRRRGSARRLARSAIGLEALEVMLAAASAQVPNDWGGPIANMHVIVNAVDGLASGAYRFDRERQQLDPTRLGDYRQIAGHLDLDQELAADAAVNVYWLADLEGVLGRLGERGYRAAQLDAALAAGRMYLAAYALGLAASGLTFFDDEVSDFFGTQDAVMFLLALGPRQRAA
jgi:SagB-type dehydrogenase family enzyme